jgi:hypothetical protein
MVNEELTLEELEILVTMIGEARQQICEEPLTVAQRAEFGPFLGYLDTIEPKLRAMQEGMLRV